MFLMLSSAILPAEKENDILEIWRKMYHISGGFYDGNAFSSRGYWAI